MINVRGDVQVFRDLWQRGVLPQVMLFHGRVGAGVLTVARQLVQVMFCETNEACEKCLDCQAVDAGKHAEVLACDARAQKFGVAEVGEVQKFLGLRSFARSGARVVIIDAVHLVTRQAANKFLKLLEEPEAGCYIFLVTNRYRKLLPTITSRCFHYVVQSGSSLPKIKLWDEFERLMNVTEVTERGKMLKKLKERVDLTQFLEFYEFYLNNQYRQRIERGEGIVPDISVKHRRSRLAEIKRVWFNQRVQLNTQLSIEVLLLSVMGGNVDV